MILPITAYGDPVLRKVAQAIAPDYPNLNELIANMYATMYAAHGVGLAAPQVGLDIRLFVIDSSPMFEDDDGNPPPADSEQGIKRVFINAQILQSAGKPWAYTEGCLSIPFIREDVKRPSDIEIRYYDEEFNLRQETFTGLTARVILHEYDHIEGKLFIDYLSPLKKRLIQRKLDRITKGEVEVKYKMRFPIVRKR
jgi:peptide deformylase